MEVVVLRRPDHGRVHRRLPEVEELLDLDPIRQIRRIPVDPFVGSEIRRGRGRGRGDEPEDGSRLSEKEITFPGLRKLDLKNRFQFKKIFIYF